MNRNELVSWAGISATPAAFILRGGLYGVTCETPNWSSFSTGQLAYASNGSDGDTITIGASTYRLKGSMAAINDIKLEATAPATLVHIQKTIAGTGVAGVDFFAASDSPNASATAVISGTNLNLTALTSGSGGNSITTTETLTPVGDVFGATTLTGGGTAGSAALQRLAPDSATYITVMPAFSANGYQSAYLPSGNYQLTVAVASSIYADLVGVVSPV